MLSNISRRSISTTRLLQTAHPPVAKSILASANYNNDSSFDPDFQINQQITSTRLPWQPPKSRKQAKIQRKQRFIKAKLEKEFDKKNEEVSQFLVTSSVSTENEESGVMFGSEFRKPWVEAPGIVDPIMEYYEKVQEYRQKYAQEFSDIAERNAQNDSSLQGSATTAHEDMSSTVGQESMEQLEQKALALVNGISWKEIKAETHDNNMKELKEKRLEALTKLYHASSQFVRPEELDEKINACLRKVSSVHSLCKSDLRKLLLEKRKMEREITLFDALNDTKVGKDSPEKLQYERKRQKEAFMAKA